MFIQSTARYKSLEPIEPPVKLPDFVVLSGLNGGGKTQLLQAIAQNVITLVEADKQLQPTKFVDHNTLAPNNSGLSTHEMLRPHLAALVARRKNFSELETRYGRDVQHRMPGANVEMERLLVRMLRQIAETAEKPVESLTEAEMFRFYPLDVGGPRDIFEQNFSMLFKQYQVRKYQNEFEQFRAATGKYGSSRCLTDEEFLKTFGDPPWFLVNKIIADAGLDYHTNFPNDRDVEEPFQFKLINNLNNAEIDFSDLSGGEKIIMSLTLSLYNSQFDIEFPKVLLMDEPDAHLHPSMTKRFLDVIQNTFVNDKRVRVIMTTHSPSTVALAPEETLYLMNKTTPRITKATKDEALRLLTSGVPTLSIDYENRRQVFVESKYDVEFYDKVNEKLRDKLVTEISINFISSGVAGQGNCDQVKEVVNKLSGYGNRSIYGIIDWDLKNCGNDFVKVLGKDKRYSLENYVFDPVLLAAFLLREKLVERNELGLAEKEVYTDFDGFEDIKLQAIADFVVTKIGAEIDDQSNSNTEIIEYVGDKKIQLPSRFLRIPGHELERSIKEAFPRLKRYKTDGELKREIITKVIDDIPGFISTDVLTLLREIQNFDK